MTAITQALGHKAPDCRGRWERIKSVVRSGGKRRTVWHIRCSVCQVTAPEDDRAAVLAYETQQRFAVSMEREAMEAEAIRAITNEIRRRMPGMSRDDAEEAADAAFRGLRRRFFRIDRDYTAKRDWQWHWDTRCKPVTEAVRAVLEEEQGAALTAFLVDDPNCAIHIVVTAPVDAVDRISTAVQLQAPPEIDGYEVLVDVRPDTAPTE